MDKLSLRIMIFALLTTVKGAWGCAETKNIAGIDATQLEKHINILHKFNEKNKKEQLIHWGSKTAVPFLADCDTDCRVYRHPLMMLCVKKMRTESAFDSLFVTWSVFLSSYKEVEDELFVREVAQLIFCLYRNILLQCDLQRHHNIRVMSPDVLNLYGKISLMPLNEVVVALNHCYVLLLEVLKEYEFFSPVSWISWFDKYWWVPPTIFFSILYQIVFYQTLYHGSFASGQ